MRCAALLATAAAGMLLPLVAAGQPAGLDRLPVGRFDVTPPSEWVRGEPGRMSVQRPVCRPVPEAGLRRRIVDIALQEWAFFGAPVLDRVNGARLLPPGVVADPSRPFFETSTRRPPPLNGQESARVAASIAGYWAVTPEGPAIVADQNQHWDLGGVGIRWRSPWSAAFISWVMCEAGLGTPDRFRHAIAHRAYVDQAIRARGGQEPASAYVAYDIGERAVEPGDLLCSGRRPAYRNLAERRRQLGAGASMHCDIVVEVDENGRRILAIGGNVLRSVSLKILPGMPDPEGGLRPVSTDRARLFAHLQLLADPVPIPSDALSRSPVLAALSCGGEDVAVGRTARVLSELGVGPPARGRC